MLVDRKYDVVIIGAGMGGGCLARQLKIQMPDLKIAVIEKKKEFDYWIGESTVEVWTDYAYRMCGLGPYLHKHQMLKAGLRFFFDSEEKDLSLVEMSENGRANYPGPPSDILSHQLDRATFDRDLCELNRKIGIDVFLGTTVTATKEAGSLAVELNKDKGHVIHTDQGVFHSTYVVDAGGRGSPLVKQMDLLQDDSRHQIASYWGRYSNVKNIDDMGDDSWKRRVNFNMRYLATNHFMYKGYWIWLIPVSDEVVSIGVSINRGMNQDKIKNGDELVSWLKQHKCFRELLGDNPVTLDFMAFAQCARHAKQHYSTDRWFLTGMSGFVLDALYSTTGPTTSYSNRLIGEMIKTDRAGNKELFEKQVKHFNIFMQGTYENIYRTVSRYKEFASFDLFIGWRNISQGHYYNTMIPGSTEDMKTLFDTVRAHGADCGCSIEKTLEEQSKSIPVAVEKLLKEMYDYVQKHNLFFANNKGVFIESTPRRSLVKKIFEPRDLDREHRESQITFEATFRHYLRRMAIYEKVEWNEDAFVAFFSPNWLTGQTLAMGLKALRDANSKGHKGKSAKIVWLPKGPVDEKGEELDPEDVIEDRKRRVA